MIIIPSLSFVYLCCFRCPMDRLLPTVYSVEMNLLL